MFNKNVRVELAFNEVVNKIKNKHNEQYCPNAKFDAWDQLLVLETVSNSTPVNENYDKETNENANASGMINVTCKHNVNFELTQSKQEVITKLKECDHLTLRIEIAVLLKEFFKEWKSKPGHWLYIAQHWSPNPINRTINQMVKDHTSGKITVKNPAAYFTKLIRFRKKRKS